MHTKSDDRIRRGAAAAVLHIATASDSTLAELARQLVAAEKAIAARVSKLPASNCLSQAFGQASLRRDIAQFMHQHAIADAPHEVRESIAYVAARHAAEIADYRDLLLDVSAAATRIVKSGKALKRIGIRRPLSLALGQIRAETRPVEIFTADSTDQSRVGNAIRPQITPASLRQRAGERLSDNSARSRSTRQHSVAR